MNNNKSNLIKQLAEEFSGKITELPIKVLPNQDIVYEKYLIKKNDQEWDLFSLETKSKLATFFLRSCALIAAKYYTKLLFQEYHEIKELDRNYKRTYIDTIFHKHNLKTTKDFDTKVILLNRIECSEADSERYKKTISRLFRLSFV